MGTVQISICIPAYKRTAYLKRLLDSVAIQTYTDFEVIVSDDSPDNSVQLLCKKYDERMKWRVDIDYYMQLLQEEKTFYFIPDVLINLGISSTQVTHSCLNVPRVELPEGKLLLDKYGTKPLKNILVYDAWWRIIRNTHTRSKDTLHQYATEWPKVIERIVEEQEKIKPLLLKNGIISKL